MAVRVTTDEATAACRRERIVLTGTNGNRVPSYLTPSLGVTGRVPLVVAIHAGASSNYACWQTESFERGRVVTDRLLAATVAIFSLDAQFHGQRSVGNDFESFRTMWFDGKKFTSRIAGVRRLPAMAFIWARVGTPVGSPP